MTLERDTSETAARDDQASESCREFERQLPLFLHGSIDAGPAELWFDHLAGCRTCSDEALEAALLRDLLDQHVESRLLAEYGVGIAIPRDERLELEFHLVNCESCRSELELIRSDSSGSEGAPAAPPDYRVGKLLSHPGRLAAAGLALVAGALWLASDRDGNQPAMETATVQAELQQASSAHAESTTDVSHEAFFTDGFESGTVENWPRVENWP